MSVFSKITGSDEGLECKISDCGICKLFNNFAKTEMLDHEYSIPSPSSLLWSEMEESDRAFLVNADYLDFLTEFGEAV